jgi:protein translocase SecG subunit
MRSRSSAPERYPAGVAAVLGVIQVLISFALVALVLMHSGFGGLGFTPFSHGGQHIVERNLTRLTVVIGTLFAINTIALYYAL